MPNTLLFDSATVARTNTFAASLCGNEADHESFDNDYQRWYAVGLFFGRLGREPFPPADLPALFLDAFHDGMQTAECEIDRDKAETFAMELAQLESEMQDLDAVSSGYSWL